MHEWVYICNSYKYYGFCEPYLQDLRVNLKNQLALIFKFYKTVEYSANKHYILEFKLRGIN